MGGGHACIVCSTAAVQRRCRGKAVTTAALELIMHIYLSKGTAGLCLKGGGEREMCAHVCARACMAVQVSCIGPLIIKYSVKQSAQTKPCSVRIQ